MSDHADPKARRKHLLSAQQLAAHADATAEDLVRSHGQGNGVRVHGTYFVIVSVAALVLLVIAIAMASAQYARAETGSGPPGPPTTPPRASR